MRGLGSAAVPGGTAADAAAALMHTIVTAILLMAAAAPRSTTAAVITDRAAAAHAYNARSRSLGMALPPFGAEFGATRAAVCVDASASHALGEANNTRWSLYALPAGTPPKGGWPIFLSLLPWCDFVCTFDSVSCFSAHHYLNA